MIHLHTDTHTQTHTDTHTHTHTHNGILLSHKKSRFLSFEALWINLEGIMLREISHTGKEKIVCYH